MALTARGTRSAVAVRGSIANHASGPYVWIHAPYHMVVSPAAAGQATTCLQRCLPTLSAQPISCARNPFLAAILWPQPIRCREILLPPGTSDTGGRRVTGVGRSTSAPVSHTV
jgi:hypothetical protein